MVMTIHVEIVGAPVSCGTEVKDTWRELSGWIARQLRWRYGDAVQVEYHDLFDVGGPTIPPGTSLPLILINGEVLTNGGKLSLPLIRRAVEALGASPETPKLGRMLADTS